MHPHAPNQQAQYFFRGLPLNEELVGMLNTVIADFYQSETSCFNYQGCKQSKAYNQLQVMARTLSDFDPTLLNTAEEKKAFWINLYNALIMHLVIVENVGKSIMEVKEFFTSYEYQLKGMSLTLDQIEHGILRGNRPNYMRFFRPLRKDHPALPLVLEADPRSMSCAALSAYHPHTLDQQLEEATQSCMERLVRIEGKKVLLPKCFLWYKKDFNGKQGSLDFVMRYHPDASIVNYIREHRNHLRIGWLGFDWRLNKCV